MKRTVVITGMGAVTPLGMGAQALHERWASGVCGIVDGAGACTDFEPSEFLSVKEVRRLDRFSQMDLTTPLVERHEVVRDVRGLGLMWAIELGPPAGGAGRALFRAVERLQPGLFAQLITVPLFHEHRILCQVAGHRMNVIKALPSLLIEEDEVRAFADALAEVVAAAERTPRAMAQFGWRMARGTARSHRPRRSAVAP
jgi:hypothetical protein